MFLGLEAGRLCSSGCRPEMRIHPLMRAVEERFCPALCGRINTGFGVLSYRHRRGYLLLISREAPILIKMFVFFVVVVVVSFVYNVIYSPLCARETKKSLL